MSTSKHLNVRSAETQKSKRWRLDQVLKLGPIGLFAVLGVPESSPAQAADAPQSAAVSVFSPVLQFQGDVVANLRSGKAIRKVAIYRGKRFEWMGKVNNRVATPEQEGDSHDLPLDVDAITEDELAEELRALALFNGHQFREAAPAHELARMVKQRRALELTGTAERDLDQVLSGTGPSRGTARGSRRHETSSTREVHGVDDRTVMDNLIYPYRVQIVFDNTNVSSGIDGAEGSGTLISPSTAVSAAHVFWDEGANTWEADFRWAPGFDSEDSDPSPYGEFGGCYWVTIPTAYTTNNSNTNDFAVIDFNVGCNSIDNGLNSDRPGDVVGWLGHYTASDDEIEYRTGYVRGYPGPGTCGEPGISCNVRVWGDYSSVSETDADGEEIHHQADTSGGMSGSGFYVYADPSCDGCGYGAYIVGIHRAGSSSYNIARRYDSRVLAFVREYSGDL